MKKRTKKLLLLGCGLLIAHQARAEAPYAKLAQMQSVFDNIPGDQRDKLILHQHVVHEDASNHTPIEMWVTDNGKRVDIPVAPDGTLTLTNHPDWIAAGLIVHTNQPPGKHLQLQLDIQIALPPTPTIPATYLLQAMDQAQAAIKAGARKAAGYLASLAAPSVTSATFKLARCCKETLQFAPPPATLSPAQSATGEITLTRDVLEENKSASLKASAPIISISAATN